MPISATPHYLGQDFSEASPGMRFGMYLKLWGINRRSEEMLWKTHDIGYEVRGQNKQEREVKYETKGDALKAATALNAHDTAVINALLQRQRQSFAVTTPADQGLVLLAQSIAPFTTGLGNEHPLENGFAFLNPYGLPYLPGSGVKGVLRQAARELASGDWGNKHGWSDEKSYPLFINDKPVLLSMLDILFGRETDSGDTEHLRGALSFWDVIPHIKANHLSVEIMTPHQKHYYQDGQSPHDSGSPNPILFLAVPPGSGFTFHVRCDLAHLKNHAPALAENEHWKTLLKAAFEHAFNWLGFGAKTAVGYGAMAEDKNATVQREAQQQEQAEAQRIANLSPAEKEREENAKAIEKFREIFLAAQKIKYQPGQDFDNKRNAFISTVSSWQDIQSRTAAADLLTETLKWGIPSKKESANKLKDTVAKLREEPQP